MPEVGLRPFSLVPNAARHRIGKVAPGSLPLQGRRSGGLPDGGRSLAFSGLDGVSAGLDEAVFAASVAVKTLDS
jgi:hypothetical protein